MANELVRQYRKEIHTITTLSVGMTATSIKDLLKPQSR
jgi:hypothetical protein